MLDAREGEGLLRKGRSEEKLNITKGKKNPFWQREKSRKKFRIHTAPEEYPNAPKTVVQRRAMGKAGHHGHAPQ